MSGWVRESSRAACRPVMPGMAMSRMARSGWWVRAASRASAPLPASATTVRSGSTCRPPGVRQQMEELYIPPSRPISSSGYGVFLLWRWNLPLKSDITAAIGACRARIAAASSGIPVGRLPSA